MAPEIPTEQHETGVLIVWKAAHGNAHNVVSLLLEEEGGDGGIYTSAHGDDDAGFGHGQACFFPTHPP